MSVKITGLDELNAKLDDLKTKATQLSGDHKISLKELFNTGFMSENTKYRTLEELLEDAGLNIKTSEEFEKYPDEKMDQVIKSHTTFQSWKEMLNQALLRWTSKQLSF